jgi:hypothetical protein
MIAHGFTLIFISLSSRHIHIRASGPRNHGVLA